MCKTLPRQAHIALAVASFYGLAGDSMHNMNLSLILIPALGPIVSFKFQILCTSTSKIWLWPISPTAASLHDSQALDYLLDESDHGQPIYADSVYVGQCNILAKWDMIDEICEKGYRNHPLTEDQNASIKKDVI